MSAAAIVEVSVVIDDVVVEIFGVSVATLEVVVANGADDCVFVSNDGNVVCCVELIGASDSKVDISVVENMAVDCCNVVEAVSMALLVAGVVVLAVVDVFVLVVADSEFLQFFSESSVIPSI